MENEGNPAQRLHDIAYRGNKRRVSTASMLVWAEIFELPAKTREQENEIISHVNECRKLVDRIEHLLLKNKEIPHDIYLRPFPKLRVLFTKPSGLSQPHATYCNLTEADFTILELCIHAVDKVYKEKVVDEEGLKQLLNEITALYEEVITKELDIDLKRVLLDMLKIMENAIHEYRIRGVERLQEAVEKFVGIYIFNQEELNKSNSEEVTKVKNLLNKFWSFYSFAANTVQLLGAPEAITKTSEAIIKLLGPGQ